MVIFSGNSRIIGAKEQLGHIIDEMDTVSMTRFMETLEQYKRSSRLYLPNSLEVEVPISSYFMHPV